ncbi:unnamed protein product, partial [Iphiclides podalirius]
MKLSKIADQVPLEPGDPIDKCSSENTLVSLTAYQGLLALVELGVLEIGHTMSTVITLLPSAHNYSATISTMAGLLVLDLRSRLIPGQVYKCQFSLKSPQHPLISVLQKNKDAEDDVLAQMHALCTHPEYKISSNSLELLRSVFFWLTCNPQWTSKNVRPWQLLLSLPQTPAQTSLLLDCISCQQICNPKQLERAFAAYSMVVDAAIYQQRREHLIAFLPMLARISNEMLKHGRDPRACYSLIERCFSLDVPELRNVAGLTLLLLAENLSRSSALYLHELFNLGLHVMNKHECPSMSVNSFAALSLQWLRFPSHLTASALAAGARLLDASRAARGGGGLRAANLRGNPAFGAFALSDAALGAAFKLAETWERLEADPGRLLSWLSSLCDAVRLQLVPFFAGLLLEGDPRLERVTVEAVKVLVRLVEARKDVAVAALPVLQYAVANDRRPCVQLECLKALPLMAKTKENIPTIVSILNKLKANRGVPTSLLIVLYTSLAETQVRCFPYLQELLVDTGVGRPSDPKWEVDLAKASAVKRICELRPSSHGLELVSVISALLNKCTDRGGALATCLALGALGALWQGAAVAPPGAWRALEPRLGRDQRPAVQIGLCRLLALVPPLRTDSAEYDRLVQEASARLWQRVADAHHPEVAEAACHALAAFRLDDFRLADLPEIYRQTVKLPPSYCKTPADAARKPEEVLDYIPSEVWPEVFRCTNQSCLEGVRVLAAGLLRRELAAYRGGAYALAARGEPLDYAHLPRASVARGLFDCLRRQVISPSYDFPEEAILCVLETLGLEYPKPLPPVDLAFLQDAMRRSGRWRQGCLRLAARQAQVSPSARRLLDAFLEAVQSAKCEETDILLMFECLPILCRGMPPNSLRGPIEQCLSDAFHSLAKPKPLGRALEVKEAKEAKEAKEVDDAQPLLVRQLRHIERCLESDKIHDANRTLLSQIVETYFGVIPDDSVAWGAYVSCCRRLGGSYLERMTSPSSWWEVSGALVRKSCSVRAALAALADCGAPLAWLNDLVDACAPLLEEQEYSLRCMMPALRHVDPDADSTKQWFVQLMGRTQAAFKETEEEFAKLYLIDVLMLSVITFSGLWSLEPDPDVLVTSRASRQALLPAASAALLSRPSWDQYTLQMLEWLCHSRGATGDQRTAQTCQRALLALRHSDHFATHRIWTRLESHFAVNEAANVDD